MEKFYFQTDLTLDNVTEDSPGTVTGLVTKWNTVSHDRGGFREVIRPHAFGDTINGGPGWDIQALYDHTFGPGGYLGRQSNGSIKLAMDEVGLRASVRLPNTQVGRDVAWLAKNGDLKGWSFGMDLGVYKWKKDGESPLREHLSATLKEISIVHAPAIPFTELEMYGMGEASEKTKLELAEFLKSEEPVITYSTDIARKKLQLLKFRLENF